jgi:hypothetical protein
MLPVVGAVVLVFGGYIALWTAGRSDTAKGTAQFGKIMAIILFVFAGLVLVGGVARRHCHRGMHEGMMEKTGCCMKGAMGDHKFWGMNKMEEPCEKGQPENMQKDVNVKK